MPVTTYSNQQDLQNALSNARVIGFDEVETSGTDPRTQIASDRYSDASGLTINGDGGFFADEDFGFADDYVPVSESNTAAPGTNKTTLTFDNANGGVSAFGTHFIDADFSSLGASSITAFNASGDQIAEQTVSTESGASTFVGFRTTTDSGEPAPNIARVELVTGEGDPTVQENEGVVLDNFVLPPGTDSGSGSDDGNGAPIAEPDSAQASVGGRVTIDVLANDVDPDGDSLSLSIAGEPTNGAVSVRDGAIVADFSDVPDFAGTAEFSYTATDPSGASATGTVTVQVGESEDSTGGTDDRSDSGSGEEDSGDETGDETGDDGGSGAPFAEPDSAEVEAGGSATIDVLANDVDPQGDDLTLSIDEEPAAGAVSVTDGAVKIDFSDRPDFTGSVDFAYTATDPDGNTDTGTVRVQVGGESDDGTGDDSGDETDDDTRDETDEDSRDDSGDETDTGGEDDSTGDGDTGGEDDSGTDSAAGPNVLTLNGTEQTLKLPFATEVRGSASAETLQVPDGGEIVNFGGNDGDRVAFSDALSAYTITSAGNQITVSNSDASATVALNGEVTLAFADGGASAKITIGAQGPAVQLGGATVDSGFDPANVNLDGGKASAIADGGGSSSGGDLPALPGDGGPSVQTSGTASAENIDGNQSGTISGNGSEDRFIFAQTTTNVTIDDFEAGDQLYFEGGMTENDVSIQNATFGDGQFEIAAGQVNVTLTNVGSADSNIVDTSTLTSELGGDALGFA